MTKSFIAGATMMRALKMAALLLPLSFGASHTNAQTLSLRLAHNLSASEPFNVAAERFAAEVGKRSNGSIKVAVYPSEQLGPNKEVLEMVKQGANVITLVDAGYLADYVPDFGVVQGPYLIKNPDDFQKLLASDLYKGLVRDAKSKGIMPLAFNWYIGSRHVIANRPIRTLEDFKGLSIRVPPVPMFNRTFVGLGARPVTLQWSEVYTGLSQNVVNAAEAPLPTIYGSKLQEVRKFVSLTGHFAAFLGVAMNAQTFDKLTPEQRTILVSEAEAAGDFLKKLTIEKEKVVRADLVKEGVTFVEPADILPFQSATASVYNEFPKWSPGLYQKVQAILQAK
ncbi:MAG: C4-dicarboxylate TRAP transporter substrate-binding protein [Burkholderiales bacterium]|nr:C4-dicarboxylate TRAP transporter substrate-binding protein [Burkholderiales bacterium]